MGYHDEFYYKDSCLIGILGGRGIGKTLTISMLAYEELQGAIAAGYDDFRIFHNGFLKDSWFAKKFPDEKESKLVEYDFQEIIEGMMYGESPIKNGLMCIDEVASIQDSAYGPMGFGRVSFSHFIIMMRKIGLTIIFAGQTEEIDKRLKMQTDIVGYPVVAKRMRGKEVGIKWVYQNENYTNPGRIRRMFYPNMDRFWGSYDTTKIIRSEQVNRQDVMNKKTEDIEDDIANIIQDIVNKEKTTKISVMEIKQKLKKDHNINWEMKQLESSLKYYGKQVTGDKSTFDFKKNFTSN
jgi:hypothetical protein